MTSDHRDLSVVGPGSSENKHDRYPGRADFRVSVESTPELSRKATSIEVILGAHAGFVFC